MPSVRIWDMEDPSHPQIAEMTKGHKFGVACVVSSLIIIVCISITIVKCMKVKNSSPKSLSVYCRPAVYQQLTDS